MQSRLDEAALRQCLHPLGLSFAPPHPRQVLEHYWQVDFAGTGFCLPGSIVVNGQAFVSPVSGEVPGYLTQFILNDTALFSH
jgi:hypothetical protein